MTTKLIDPFDIISTRETASEKAATQHAFTHEIMLEPPPGKELARLTVASTYRNPVPIQYDYENRTAYPIRNVR